MNAVNDINHIPETKEDYWFAPPNQYNLDKMRDEYERLTAEYQTRFIVRLLTLASSLESGWEFFHKLFNTWLQRLEIF